MQEPWSALKTLYWFDDMSESVGPLQDHHRCGCTEPREERAWSKQFHFNPKQSKTSIDLFSLQNGKPPKSTCFAYIDVDKPRKHYKMGNLQFEAIFGYLQNASFTKLGNSLAHPDRHIVLHNYFASSDPTVAFNSSHLAFCLANLLAFCLRFYLACLLAFYLSYLLTFYLAYLSGIPSGMSSDIVSGKSSDILSGKSIWHSIWQIF